MTNETQIDRAYRWLTENPEQFNPYEWIATDEDGNPHMSFGAWVYLDVADQYGAETADLLPLKYWDENEAERIVDEYHESWMCAECKDRYDRLRALFRDRDRAVKYCNHRTAESVAAALRPHLSIDKCERMRRS